MIEANIGLSKTVAGAARAEPEENRMSRQELFKLERVLDPARNGFLIIERWEGGMCHYTPTSVISSILASHKLISEEKELETLKQWERSQGQSLKLIQENKELKKDKQSLIKDNQRLQRKVKEPISVDRIDGLKEYVCNVSSDPTALKFVEIPTGPNPLVTIEEFKSLQLDVDLVLDLKEDHEKVVSQLEALKTQVQELADEVENHRAFKYAPIQKLEEKVAELEKRPEVVQRQHIRAFPNEEPSYYLEIKK